MLSTTAATEGYYSASGGSPSKRRANSNSGGGDDGTSDDGTSDGDGAATTSRNAGGGAYSDSAWAHRKDSAETWATVGTADVMIGGSDNRGGNSTNYCQEVAMVTPVVTMGR